MRGIRRALAEARNRKVTIAFFLFASLSDALILVYVVRHPGEFRFPLELLTILTVLWCCSVAEFVIKGLRPFILCHTLRALLVVLVLSSLSDRSAFLNLLVLLPFVLDTTLYLRTAPAALVSGGTILLKLTQDLLGGGEGTRVPVFQIVADAAVLAGAALSGLFMTRYREELVRISRREEELVGALTHLEHANAAFQNYAERVETLSEDKERHRITREIHDVIGYALTNIGMLLQAAKAVARTDSGRVDELLDAARDQAKTALQESRGILYKLRARTAGELYGHGAIHRLARSLQMATGIEVEVSFGNVPRSLGVDLDGALFRFVQEGITNAIKHGMARRISISYWMTDREVQVRVLDDGGGAAGPVEGIGFAGMKERFAAFGGRVEAQNVVDGFLLGVYIPLEALGNADT